MKTCTSCTEPIGKYFVGVMGKAEEYVVCDREECLALLESFILRQMEQGALIDFIDLNPQEN